MKEIIVENRGLNEEGSFDADYEMVSTQVDLQGCLQSLHQQSRLVARNECK